MRRGRDGADIPPAGAAAGDAGLAAAAADRRDASPSSSSRTRPRSAKAPPPPRRCSKAARSPGWSSSPMSAAIAAPTMPGGRRRWRISPTSHWLRSSTTTRSPTRDWLERLCAAGENFGADHRRRAADSGLPRQQRQAVHRPSGLRAALPAERAGRRALFVRQSADRPPCAGRHGRAVPRPELQLHGRRRFRFPEPGSAQRASSSPGAPRRRSAKPCRRAGSKPTGSARAACATASSRHWSRRRSAPASPVGNLRVFAKSLALLAASPFRGLVAAGADRLAFDRHLSRLCRARPRAGGIRLFQ